MKKLSILIYFLLIVLVSVEAQISLGGIIDRGINRAEQNINNRIDKRIDKGVNKVLDGVENKIDTLASSPKKEVEETEGIAPKPSKKESDLEAKIQNQLKIQQQMQEQYLMQAKKQQQASTKSSSTTPGDYKAAKREAKSMIITYESTTQGMGTNSVGTKTVTFDDYGMKEVREQKSTNTVKTLGKSTVEQVHQLDIISGGFAYNIDLIKKTGTKMDIAQMMRSMQPYGIANTGDYQKYSGKDGMKLYVEENGGTWHGEESILGKNCWVFTLMGVKIWMYKSMPLKTESSVWGIEVKEIATSIKEDVSVSASVFELPSGITMTDAPTMEDINQMMQKAAEEDK